MLGFLTLLVAFVVILGGFSTANAQRPETGPYDTPDYYETPNWAYSPQIVKFQDDLAPLGCDGIDFGADPFAQCIPVAVPDTDTYPGSDYYEIELVQFRERMSSFFPDPNNNDKTLATSGGTMVRGYRQINPGGVSTPNAIPHYMGPTIVAQKDRPVRIKFINSLPTHAEGDELFIPVDTSMMGSGDFEINFDPQTNEITDPITGTFTQNRALLHLHGGRTPWISDGTPHQWTTPVGEADNGYLRGSSI